MRIVYDRHVIAEHVRDWEAENVHYDPVHYLALLQRKPNSLDFGKPFEQWNLPSGFAVLRRRLESQSGGAGRREFIRILRLLENHPPEELGAPIDALSAALSDRSALHFLFGVYNLRSKSGPSSLPRLIKALVSFPTVYGRWSLFLEIGAKDANDIRQRS